jgi:hypothetical protein
MSTSGGAGFGGKPVFAPGQDDTIGATILGPETRSIMSDPRQQLTLREGLFQGNGKAHRAVTFAHFDFRNFKRSYLRDQGRHS